MAEIRTAIESDFSTIHEIYSYYVENSSATFEITTPSPEDMHSRLQGILDSGLPFIVAEIEGEVVGYAYASSYRRRSGYQYTLEDSVYIKDGFSRKGLGKSLLNNLIDQCESLDYKQLLAVITIESGVSEKVSPSTHLHEACGFETSGRLIGVGSKFDKCYDTLLMQKTLGSNAR